MRQRQFLSNMIKMGVACAFLPGAGRVWTKLGSGVLVPEIERDQLLRRSVITFTDGNGRILHQRHLDDFEAAVLFDNMNGQSGEKIIKLIVEAGATFSTPLVDVAGIPIVTYRAARK